MRAIHELTAAMTVIYCDAKVQNVQRFESSDDLKLVAKGGGGTDFIPPFEYLAKRGEEPELFLYFTDGYCSSFPPEPPYEVIWLVTDKKNFKPPFGDVIYIH